jgi:hypothetical protein
VAARKARKPLEPTGLPCVDRLEGLPDTTLLDYLSAVSEYVREEERCLKKKAAQVRLSNALGRVLVSELRVLVPRLQATAGEREVSGALRVVKADVSEYHSLDGLRLAVEIKPVNLAVGRAIWNRFGDIRTFAVNLHLKFPFSVIGGVLVIPTTERTKEGHRKPTTHLIMRAVARLVRAGGRRTEGDASHLLEAIAVVVYDPATGVLDPNLPPSDTGLRWDDFIKKLAFVYDSRFGEGEIEAEIEGDDDEGE